MQICKMTVKLSVSCRILESAVDVMILELRDTRRHAKLAEMGSARFSDPKKSLMDDNDECPWAVKY